MIFVTLTFAYPAASEERALVNTSDRWLAVKTVASQFSNKMSHVLLITASDLEGVALDEALAAYTPVEPISE